MIAKIFVFCAAVAAVQSMGVPIISTGVSTSSRQQDAIGNYAFGYNIADGVGATNSRSEVGDAHGNKKGSYSLTDKDGRARVVEYAADGLGFRAAVKTNEPGTAMSAPAAAAIISPYAAPVAPVAAAPVMAAGVLAPLGAVSHGSVINHVGVVGGHGAGMVSPLGLGMWGSGVLGKSGMWW